MSAELLALAEELAVSAGRLANDGRRRLGVGQIAAHDTKSSPTDPVTEFDVAAEQLIVDTLRTRRPDDAVVGEEGANHAGTSGLAWHVDPIDGTANFVYDLPAWCTSVAVVDELGSLVGAVYAPVTDELFSAVRGTGAWRNGEPIACSTTAALDQALVASGFSYSVDRRRVQARRLASLIPQVRDLRRFGSAALDLCMVGCGRLDGYFEEHLNSWDLAAGLLVATEAGAVATDFAGGTIRPESAVVATPGVHRALLDLLDPTAPPTDS
jgi:myo-inositol-1(or 4)-monophosphatase